MVSGRLRGGAALASPRPAIAPATTRGETYGHGPGEGAQLGWGRVALRAEVTMSRVASCQGSGDGVLRS